MQNLGDVLICTPQPSSEGLIPVGDEDTAMSLTGSQATRPFQTGYFGLSDTNEWLCSLVYIDLVGRAVYRVQPTPQYRQPHYLLTNICP